MRDYLRNLDNVLGRLRLLAIVALSGSALILVVYYVTNNIDLALVIAALVIAVLFIAPMDTLHTVVHRIGRTLLKAWLYGLAFMESHISAAANNPSAIRWVKELALANVSETGKKALLLLARPIHWMRAVKTYLQELTTLREEVAALREEVAALREEVAALREEVAALWEEVQELAEHDD